MYIFVSENGKYIGLDAPSGGYPYETSNIKKAVWWENVGEAESYFNHFEKENWTLKKLQITLS